MRLDRFGRELRRFDLLHLLRADRSLYLLSRQGQRGRRARLRIAQSPVNVVGGSRTQLGAVASNQLDIHIDDGDRLVAIIGNDEKHRQKVVFPEVDGEDTGFVRRVVRVGAHRNLFLGMLIVRRIGLGGTRHGLNEILGRECDRQARNHGDHEKRFARSRDRLPRPDA